MINKDDVNDEEMTKMMIMIGKYKDEDDDNDIFNQSFSFTSS